MHDDGKDDGHAFDFWDISYLINAAGELRLTYG